MTDNEVIGVTKYFERLLEEQRIYFLARLDALEKQTSILAGMMEKRLDGMNEFRKSNEDQAARSVTRLEFEAFRELFAKTIKPLETAKDRAEGKASQNAVLVAYVIGGIGLLVAILGYLK
jgi:hypothetical protein